MTRKQPWSLEMWQAYGKRCRAVRVRVNTLSDVIADTPGLRAKTIDSVNMLGHKLQVAMCGAENTFAEQHPDAENRAIEIIHGSSSSWNEKHEAILKACRPDRVMDARGRWKRPALSVEQWKLLANEVSQIIEVVWTLACEIRKTKGGTSAYGRFARLYNALCKTRSKLDDLMYTQRPEMPGSNSPFYCSECRAMPTEDMIR